MFDKTRAKLTAPIREPAEIAVTLAVIALAVAFIALGVAVTRCQ